MYAVCVVVIDGVIVKGIALVLAVL